LARLSPLYTLFPYTTRFRSLLAHARAVAPRARAQHAYAKHIAGVIDDERRDQQRLHRPSVVQCIGGDEHAGGEAVCDADFRRLRSEEHTSELQSREKLVCRL